MIVPFSVDSDVEEVFHHFPSETSPETRRDETNRTSNDRAGFDLREQHTRFSRIDWDDFGVDGSGIGDRERERQWVSRRFDRVIFRALEPRARREVCSSEWRHEIGNLACLAQCLFPRTRSAAGARQSGFLERPKWGDESKPA